MSGTWQKYFWIFIFIFIFPLLHFFIYLLVLLQFWIIWYFIFLLGFYSCWILLLNFFWTGFRLCKVRHKLFLILFRRVIISQQLFVYFWIDLILLNHWIFFSIDILLYRSNFSIRIDYLKFFIFLGQPYYFSLQIYYFFSISRQL